MLLKYSKSFIEGMNIFERVIKPNPEYNKYAKRNNTMNVAWKNTGEQLNASMEEYERIYNIRRATKRDK